MAGGNARQDKQSVEKWFTPIVSRETVEMLEIYLALSDDRTEANIQLPSMGGPQKMSADELSDLIRLLVELRAGMFLTHGADPTPKIETIGMPTPNLQRRHLNENRA